MADRRRARQQVSPARGQPLVFLVTVLLLWVSARAVHYLVPAGGMSSAASVKQLQLGRVTPASAAPLPHPAPQGVMALLGLQAHAAARNTGGGRLKLDRSPQAVVPVEIAMSHQRMWIESLSAGGPGQAGGQGSPLVDRPLQVATAPVPATVPAPALASRPNKRRWSVYGWSLIRQGSQPPVLAAGGQYGGSQAGLVVRLAMGTNSYSPVLYARATAALASSDDRSLALGMSARPWPGVPLDLAVERRFGLGSGQRDQFAAMVIGGASIADPRSGVQMEGYGQAGIVGLDDPRGFFDLQMLAARPVAQADDRTLSVGAGLWAGGQQNADADGDKNWLYRVDVGPHAAVSLPVEGSRMTLALDWRQRIDGNAQPQSGAAITLSAGF